MYFEQLPSFPGPRYILHPVCDIPIAELEDGIVDPPHPPVGQYRQVFVFPDDQMPREAAVELPAGVDEALLYIFLSDRSPP